MIGEMIKKYRLLHGLSQEALGAKIIVNGEPVSGKTIWSWESGRTEPKMGAVQQLADVFGVTTDTLIMNDTSSSPRPTLPEFKTAQEAIKFILEVPMVAQFGGYNLDTMSDQELIDMANLVAQLIRGVAVSNTGKGENDDEP